jgi:hypothetical protein
VVGAAVTGGGVGTEVREAYRGGGLRGEIERSELKKFLCSRFHVFTLRILGHVPRLTPPAIDQQSSHRSSRGGPPGFAPARCLRTHAIRGMTTKATRQARQVEA